MSSVKTPHNVPDLSKVIIASLDFETIGLDSDAIIIGLGADIVGPRRRYTVEHFPINAVAGQYRRTMDPDTVNFWRTMRSDSLRLGFESAMAGMGVTLEHAVGDLLTICESAIAYHGDGASIFWLFKPALFDGALLQSACRTLGPKWEKRLDAVSGGVYRRQALDLNSLKFLANMVGVQVPEFPKPGQLHNPRSDASAQMAAYKLVVEAVTAAMAPHVGPPAPSPQLRYPVAA